MGYDKALCAVIRVGDGRGFVVAGKLQKRLVITAAHCLPSFPPCHTASDPEDRIYKQFLGPLDAEPTVWAECLFVDPIADLAVLGAPGHPDLYDKNQQYKALTWAMTPLRIAKAEENTPAFLLSLDGRWLAGRVSPAYGTLWIKDAKSVPGMSGSPIIDQGGRAIGVVCTGGESERSGPDGPNAELMHSLPRWVPPLR